MIVFDFEVFKYDWLVVFKDTASQKYTPIINDYEALKNFYNKHKNELHIGFNNKRYDNLVYRATLDGADPYVVNQMIIEYNDPLQVYRTWNLNKYWYPSMDVSQDSMMGSLKEYEGFLGLDIDETTVPFDIDRKLTDNEIQEVLDYCYHDVDATEVLIEKNMPTLQAKINLINSFNLTMRDLDKTNAQLVAEVLLDDRHEYHDEFEPFPFENHTLDLPEIKGEVKVGSQVIRESTIFDFYNRPPVYEERLEIVLSGVKHILRYGGLHGARENYIYRGEMWLLDVTSYYPSLMLEFGYLSRNAKYDEYREIYDERVRIKKSDPVRSDVLKLILNTTFGASKDEFNPLYDPRQANNICISGQLLLIDLIHKLGDNITLLFSNTDGILVIPHDKDEVKRIKNEWERTHGLNMEIDVISELYMKDVNNYIAVEPNGKLTLKGGYVAQSTINGNKPWGLRRTDKIVADAIVNYFVNDISPEKTIMDANDKLDFQLIRKTGNTFDHTVHEINGLDHRVQNVNRVYPTKDKRYGKLFKVDSERRNVVPSLPEHCYVANKDNFDFTNIDKTWYIDRAWERINDYKTR